MQGDDPPYLSVGTAVSAKYKGAFCEAKVSKVVRIVKCKVTYKSGLGTSIVNDEHIKGPLRVGQLVQAKHPDKKDFMDATITKIQDCSQYTVVFDDGDITTLRRTALCLKSGRHFNESETLDQLPLTHPEHFGNPVVGGRRGRRSRQLKEDSSEGEVEEENEPDLEFYSADMGRVVCVETSEKKRGKDNWFPGLVVMPSAQPTVRINVKDEFLVRSFKDGRYYTVPKKEVTEFTREIGSKVESNLLSEAVEKAIRYLDHDEFPVHWERSSLFNTQSPTSDSDENFTDSSEDEALEKDHFVAQLYKFMDDSNTPLNKSPVISNKDVDLYRLFRLVSKLGGYNRVTNKNKWRAVTTRLKFPNNQNVFNQVKQVYKKCLLSYEAFNRTLGCTMLNHPRNAKKSRGRSLIRDKDRVTPVNSPRPDKEDFEVLERKEEKIPEEKPVKPIKKYEFKKDDEKKRKEPAEDSESDSGDASDQSEVLPGPSKERPKRVETKVTKERKVKTPVGDKVKNLIEKFEEVIKKEEKEEDKIQQTRSKSQGPRKETSSPDRKIPEIKPPVKDSPPKTVSKPVKKVEEEKKRGRKRLNTDEKTTHSDSSSTETIVPPAVNIGDKLKVYYGPTHESKVTYEAKVIEVDHDSSGIIYLVHYTGWNTRYDEWINPGRIAENLSASTKAKRLKMSGNSSKASTPKAATKRGRGMSITGRSTTQESPRAMTPSNLGPSTSRTKSPGTPTRMFKATRQGEYGRRTRRTSAQTEPSIHSESNSDGSESELEGPKSRPGSKGEETEGKVFRRRGRPFSKDKRKEDDDNEKEEDCERVRRTRKVKKASNKSESDDDTPTPPKGRDFDLNQIRSELKGFTKVVKVPTALESAEKDDSSDDSINIPMGKDDMDEPDKEKSLEKSSSSEDIYEFKEPEPFEFETRPKILDSKDKKRIGRLFDDTEKSPKKKTSKSPVKTEVKEEAEKKRFKRTPVKKEEPEEDEEDKKEDVFKKAVIDDAFDRLIESPSFHIGKATTEKSPNTLTSTSSEGKSKVSRILNLDEPLNLFSELPEIEDDDHSNISDNDDSQSEPLFSHKEQLFSDATFAKASPDPTFKGFTPKTEERRPKDDDSVRASIQRVVAQTSLSDDDSDDALLINQPTVSYQGKKKEPEIKLVESESDSNLEIVETKEIILKEDVPIKLISPALQESDSALLEAICTPSEILTKLDEPKEIIVKTGTKIADSILQKFSMIKNKDQEKEVKAEVKKEIAQEPVPQLLVEENLKLQEPKTSKTFELKAADFKSFKTDSKTKTSETKSPGIEPRTKPNSPAKAESESKKRSSRKVLSREFIEESDTDSNDSEQLVIARSDDDSQTNMSSDSKMEIKEESSSSLQMGANEPSAQRRECSFKFEPIKEQIKTETKVENVKEEEPDSHLHSLLLCEETIPGSPAPVAEGPLTVEKPKEKSMLEMPFASAPGSSNNKTTENRPSHKEKVQPPAAMPLEREREVSTVLDNTPPTTPESTLSNLSPRNDPDALSPNTADNESSKSTEADGDYPNRRVSPTKPSPYSEDDVPGGAEPNTSIKKTREDPTAAPCKKRRKSCRGSDEIPIVKRGRKPLNRSRHNSDSDDTSEHSLPGSTPLGSSASIDARLARSPRPSKYNFYVELDPSLDSGQRISLLQQKLSELRKTYAEVKTELATIERRRKKIRRREREALKAAKQEATAT